MFGYSSNAVLFVETGLAQTVLFLEPWYGEIGNHVTKSKSGIVSISATGRLSRRIETR